MAGDLVRGLIADAARPPKPLVPPPFIQKEAPTGYSYQQINCLDSIIRCVCEQVYVRVRVRVHVRAQPPLLIQLSLHAGTWTAATFPTQ